MFGIKFVKIKNSLPPLRIFVTSINMADTSDVGSFLTP